MPTRLTPRYTDALQYAIDAHGGQLRKASAIPYVSHLLGVSSLVLEHGGDEDEAIGALLHDVVEDCGAHHEAPVRLRYGGRVADIVLACSDSTCEERKGLDTLEQRRKDWQARKRAYVAGLALKSRSALLVSCCDKLHNARSIADAADGGLGATVFERFTASPEGTLWYYRALAEGFIALGVPGADALTREVGRMHAMAQAA